MAMPREEEAGKGRLVISENILNEWSYCNLIDFNIEKVTNDLVVEGIAKFKGCHDLLIDTKSEKMVSWDYGFDGQNFGGCKKQNQKQKGVMGWPNVQLSGISNEGRRLGWSSSNADLDMEDRIRRLGQVGIFPSGCSPSFGSGAAANAHLEGEILDAGDEPGPERNGGTRAGDQDRRWAERDATVALSGHRAAVLEPTAVLESMVPTTLMVGSSRDGVKRQTQQKSLSPGKEPAEGWDKTIKFGGKALEDTMPLADARFEEGSGDNGPGKDASSGLKGLSKSMTLEREE
ncbi:hypothetical protein HN873_029471 [Arachis hypogaea]